MNNLLVRDVKYLDEQYRIGEGIISDDAFKQLEKLFIPVDPQPGYFNQKNNKLFLNQSISLWRCKYKPIKEKKLPTKIDKFNWIQIIEGNLLLKSKDSNSNIFLESGDGLGFEVNYYDDVSIDTEKDLDFLLFSMPYL